MRRLSLLFPEPRVHHREARAVHDQHTCVIEARCFVPVFRLGSALVPLFQHAQLPCGDIEPRDPRTERGRDPLRLWQLQPVALALAWPEQRRLWDKLKNHAPVRQDGFRSHGHKQA